MPHKSQQQAPDADACDKAPESSGQRLAALGLEIAPCLEEFRQLAVDRRVIPVTVRVLADAHTPISLYRALADGAPGSFLMESAAPGGVWSRHSFIGAASNATLTSKDGQAHWIGQPPVGVPLQGNPAEVLEATVRLLHTEPLPGLPSFTSGLAGFLGWDMVRHWERLPEPPQDDLGLPELAMNLVSDMAVHDNTDGSVLLIANVVNVDGSDDRVDEAWHEAAGRLEAMLSAIAAPGPRAVGVPAPAEIVDRYRSAARERWHEPDYLEAIRQAKQAIVDGEIFQVVISRRFELDNTENDAESNSDHAVQAGFSGSGRAADPLDVYRMLRAANPSPYMYLYSFADPRGGEYSVVGSSPEALVTVSGQEVITHPIAGSRPRGGSVEADQALAADLLSDAKERAEHLMLVDLARNDLAKVCVPGSVDVSQFMEVERFSHIMHLVSTVVGTLAPGNLAYDTLAATFPAGTLSGAPKPRAMQLLDRYEPHRRGIYGGVVGYLDFAGNMDTAICIRTTLLRAGVAYVQAGGGIVADSRLEDEALETVNKAAAPLRAVYAAQRLRTVPAAGDLA